MDNDGLIKQIKDNIPLVYEAGYNKCLKENPPGATEEELQEKYEEGYNSGHEDGKTEGVEEGLNTAIATQEAFLANKPQTYYDAFWDNFQQNGARVNYANAFGGMGWNAETFKPKYPIKLSGISAADRMFEYFNRISIDINIDDLFDFSELNNTVDFSKSKRLLYTFANARIKNLYCDCSSATLLQSTFEQSNGGNIDNLTLKITPITTTFTNAFAYAYGLKSLTFTEDSNIAGNINLQWSTLLNKASIESIINALSTTTEGLTVTLSQTAIDNAFTPEEWEALEATKSNWNISLVQGG